VAVDEVDDKLVRAEGPQRMLAQRGRRMLRGAERLCPNLLIVQPPGVSTTNPAPTRKKMTQKNVAVIIGSLRKDSLNRKMAQALMDLAPKSVRLEIVEIGQLSHYNPDDDEAGKTPAAWSAFRQRIKAAAAVLFVTPEYNRSVPAVLKNALDVGSRPYGQSAWDRKPAAIVSVSPGALGAFGANHHLRQSLVFLNMPALQQPEAYIGGAAQLFDADGKLTNDGTRGFLQKFAQTFEAWIDANTPK
jgi:chromate reductase